MRSTDLSVAAGGVHDELLGCGAGQQPGCRAGQSCGLHGGLGGMTSTLWFSDRNEKAIKPTMLIQLNECMVELDKRMTANDQALVSLGKVLDEGKHL